MPETWGAEEGGVGQRLDIDRLRHRQFLGQPQYLSEHDRRRHIGGDEVVQFCDRGIRILATDEPAVGRCDVRNDCGVES